MANTDLLEALLDEQPRRYRRPYRRPANVERAARTAPSPLVRVVEIATWIVACIVAMFVLVVFIPWPSIDLNGFSAQFSLPTQHAAAPTQQAAPTAPPAPTRPKINLPTPRASGNSSSAGSSSGSSSSGGFVFPTNPAQGTPTPAGPPTATPDVAATEAAFLAAQCPDADFQWCLYFPEDMERFAREDAEMALLEGCPEWDSCFYTPELAGILAYNRAAQAQGLPQKPVPTAVLVPTVYTPEEIPTERARAAENTQDIAPIADDGSSSEAERLRSWLTVDEDGTIDPTKLACLGAPWCGGMTNQQVLDLIAAEEAK